MYKNCSIQKYAISNPCQLVEESFSATLISYTLKQSAYPLNGSVRRKVSPYIVIWLFHLFDLKLCTVYQFNSKYNGLIIVMHLN